MSCERLDLLLLLQAQARKCPLLAGQSSTPADTGYHVIELLVCELGDLLRSTGAHASFHNLLGYHFTLWTLQDSDEEPADAIQDARQLSNMSGTAVPGQELHIPLAPCQTHVASQVRILSLYLWLQCPCGGSIAVSCFPSMFPLHVCRDSTSASQQWQHKAVEPQHPWQQPQQHPHHQQMHHHQLHMPYLHYSWKLQLRTCTLPACSCPPYLHTEIGSCTLPLPFS
jgi:hypothetical protein